MVEWTGVRYADGPTVEVEIWIDAPPERVWGIVSDIGAMPGMSPELQSVSWCDGAAGGPALGRGFTGTNRHPAMGEWTTTSYIVECDEPRAFAWAVGAADHPATTWRFTLEPRDGGTMLRQWMRMGPAPSGLSIAIERMPDKEQKIVFVRLREHEKAMTGTVAAVKERAEGA